MGDEAPLGFDLAVLFVQASLGDILSLPAILDLNLVSKSTTSKIISLLGSSRATRLACMP